MLLLKCRTGSSLHVHACMFILMHVHFFFRFRSLLIFPTRLLGMRVPLDQAQSLSKLSWLLVYLPFVACLRVLVIFRFDFLCFMLSFAVIGYGRYPPPHVEGQADTICYTSRIRPCASNAVPSAWPESQSVTVHRTLHDEAREPKGPCASHGLGGLARHPVPAHRTPPKARPR